ncbi:MAG: DUF4331 family protein [Candidatus Eremiobacterota bacterium]
MKKNLTLGLMAALLGAGLMTGCGEDNVAPGAAQAQPAPIADGNFTQVERLARPAINEGLLLTNDFLNAYNAIPPSADTSAAAQPVLAEAAATLTAVRTAGVGLGVGPGPTVQQVVDGFIPDVMRIDTSLAVAPGTASYNQAVFLPNGSPMLVGGRKLSDDVIDITLSYLIAFDPTGATVNDGVTYAGAAGNPAQGHQPLIGTFPYLAPAN